MKPGFIPLAILRLLARIAWDSKEEMAALVDVFREVRRRFFPAFGRALPHLDAGTVRTHVVSRCCTNAPANHPHRWDYFQRVDRGLYEIRGPYRRRRHREAREVAERPASSAWSAEGPLRETVHAVVRRGHGWFVAECLEVAVVTQGRTLDELVESLREAVTLHLEGEDATALGLVPTPRLAVTYELPARSR